MAETAPGLKANAAVGAEDVWTFTFLDQVRRARKVEWHMTGAERRGEAAAKKDSRRVLYLSIGKQRAVLEQDTHTSSSSTWLCSTLTPLCHIAE